MKQTKKSLETKELIYKTAIQLFQEKGFENVTMREISKKSGLSLGLTYYYFKTKEELVFEFYKNAQTECEAVSFDYFRREKNFQKRISHVIETRIQYFTPYSKFLHVLAEVAGHPNHPLSPFSIETKEIRDRGIEVFRVALSDIDIKIPEDLKAILPEVFWLYQLGVVYFWLWDSSENKWKTTKLLEISLGAIFKFLNALSLPILKKLRKPILDIYKVIQK
ncbi:MAG: TetR/AcrR family transcriptional regulator [Leptospiraceae bacterium]|nr:TetR/AcrR family transcriptional regulator [Leptospiraceae bacterium]